MAASACKESFRDAPIAHAKKAHWFKASFNALAGAKVSFLAAATLIVAPVAGLRASRSGVSFTLNLPKPGMEVSAIPRQS